MLAAASLLVTVALARNDVFNTYHVVSFPDQYDAMLSQMSRRRASGNETNEHAVTIKLSVEL